MMRKKAFEKCHQCGAELPYEKVAVPIFRTRVKQTLSLKCPACKKENKLIFYKAKTTPGQSNNPHNNSDNEWA